jgi:hypothetical protein
MSRQSALYKLLWGLDKPWYYHLYDRIWSNSRIKKICGQEDLEREAERSNERYGVKMKIVTGRDEMMRNNPCSIFLFGVISI